jgi:hypothetical protein
MENNRTIEQHINEDKEELSTSNLSAQRRRHIESELGELESYAENHKRDIEEGDHHDPSPLELYCDTHPDADECRIYED